MYKSILALIVVLSALAMAGAAFAGELPMPPGCKAVKGDANSCTKAGDGRPIWFRFFIGAQGMGVVKCGGCSTAAGCTALWCGGSVGCEATPAPGWVFTHWSANGNFAGDKPTKRFCKRGATLKGHFEKKDK